jgi:hypothetical protein
MLELKVRAGRRSVAPEALPALLGAQRAYYELGDMVEALIAQMDALEGDPDLEPEEDRCEAGDDMVAAGPIVDTGRDLGPGDECDCEDNGDETDGNGAEDEECGYFRHYGTGPGCVVSDPDRDGNEGM